MPLDPRIRVRPARPEELDAVGALTAAAYVAGGALAHDDDGYVPVLRDAAARAAAGPVLVATLDDALAGTATLCPPGSAFSEIAGPDEGEVRFLAVDPTAWGRGVADALMAGAADWARAAGYVRLVLFVLEGNDAAHRLYARLGFRRVPERDWRPVPDLLLQAYARPVPA